jgi:hypothetical protein
MWLKAMQTEDKAVRQKILAEIVQGYSAIVDGPGCFFVEDWIEMYPDAKVGLMLRLTLLSKSSINWCLFLKVVLGLRTLPQAWLDSVNGSIAKVFGKWPMYYIAYFVPEMHFGFLINDLWDQQTEAKYGVGVGVRSTECYAYHNDHARKVVPKERLLEFKAADGWELLCTFLGKDVPQGKYPHRNGAKAANQLMKSFAINGIGI